MWNLAPRGPGEIVILEPLSEEHFGALLEAARPPEISTWWTVAMAGEAAFRRWFDDALRAGSEGTRAPFATLDARSERPIDATGYLTLRPEHAGLEIGCTWLNPAAWRSGANAEAKPLLLRHASEAFGCQRVEFSANERNERARRALEALPAQFEGVKRDDRLLHGGNRRSSAINSILDRGWPAVEASLGARVASARSARAAG